MKTVKYALKVLRGKKITIFEKKDIALPQCVMTVMSGKTSVAVVGYRKEGNKQTSPVRLHPHPHSPEDNFFLDGCLLGCCCPFSQQQQQKQPLVEP